MEVDRVARAEEEEFVVRHDPADGEWALGLKLRAALKRGDLVAMAGDRVLPGARVAENSFFGKPASFPIGPYLLARSADVPLVAVFLRRSGYRRYEMTFRKLGRAAAHGERHSKTCRRCCR